mmetsp:Transcript_14609/g.16862  ORF Transcript_14609/g.16862 Transcript_14609/m.16862 type:complete len:89 (-) Transcript_14609:185-451(-)
MSSLRSKSQASKWRHFLISKQPTLENNMISYHQNVQSIVKSFLARPLHKRDYQLLRTCFSGVGVDCMFSEARMESQVESHNGSESRSK